MEPWKGRDSSFQQLNNSAWSPGEVPLGLCGPAECLFGCMRKERCLPTTHLCDGEKQAIVPMCPPTSPHPNCSSYRLGYSREAAALRSNPSEQVTCHLHPRPRNQNSGWEYSGTLLSRDPIGKDCDKRGQNVSAGRKEREKSSGSF